MQSSEALKPSMVRAGAYYFSLAGCWTFEVEQIQGRYVLYRVVETQQRCKVTRDEFAERVRPAQNKP